MPNKNSKKRKIRSAALDTQVVHHEPLGQQVIQHDDGKHVAATAVRRPSKKPRRRVPVEDEESKRLLDEKSSQKILELGKAQQLEMEAEEAAAVATTTRRNQPPPNFPRRREERRDSAENNSDNDDDYEEELLTLGKHDDNDNDDGGDDDYYTIERSEDGYVTISDGNLLGLSVEDEALVHAMMQGSEERKTLADVILDKIEEKETEQQQEARAKKDDNDDDGTAGQLPPKVVQVYTEIGKLLSHYTSGKLPKAFKVIPSLRNWEEVLYLTRPDLWTPQAMFAATRIFASNLNPKMAQRFYNLVLLDSVRNDIYQHKKLNYHYYMALKKAVYKPAAFFKGILLPLCQDDCTLREAAIVASVLQRVSIPVHHSAVALHKLAESNRSYSGATSIFIKTLLNKKYSLPAPVISSLVRHFARFVDYEKGELPVLWHQALLVFVQRYKHEVQDEARESLKVVMKKHFHHKITPEIRRELFGAQAYKEERQQVAKSMQL